uniref:Rheb n=1 Tax=Malawimonas sp. TaxID=2152667 RepID=A0A2R4IKW9_9EUKA|nr:Rheb [Malawimonas sp.]|eukprot:TRINITY_DN3489_c0_g1_i1.p1 TRINITY_DN3489_c0_g1~~TRINITY_DN3489_c0_g1_i1.p1  ORF type:complete len:189 (-),score=20.55 TRINITY_DN3489_c0_g1_i1:76-642(-)
MAAKSRKVVVMGYFGVGKSAVTAQFVQGEFPGSYNATVMHSNYRKTIKVRGQEFDLEILDTAGQYESSNLDPHYGLGVDGYIFVYGINSIVSFNTCKAINDKVLNLWGTASVPLVLVGNKSDLAAAHRQVSRDEAETLAGQWGCEFVECSAKDNQNVDTVFMKLLDQMEKARPSAPSSGKQSGGCSLM